MDERKQRIAASGAVGKLIGAHPEQFDVIGHRPGSPIVVCLESDCISDVLNRVMREVPEPPATVAIYWAKTCALGFLSFQPGSPNDERADIDGTSTLGMLYSYLGASETHSLNFNTAASSTTIRSYQPVAA